MLLERGLRAGASSCSRRSLPQPIGTARTCSTRSGSSSGLRARARKGRGTTVGLEPNEDMSVDDKVRHARLLIAQPALLVHAGARPRRSRPAAASIPSALPPSARAASWSGAAEGPVTIHLLHLRPQKRIIEERMKYINQKFGKGTIGKLSDAPMKV
jgi:hypothetical protein